MHPGLAVCTALIATLLGTIASDALAAPAGPDALPVHVVNVKSTEALDQAEALTSAIKKAVRDSDGWSLGDTDTPLEFLALQMKCPEPIDAACEARIADVIKADRYLWSVIEFDPADKTMIVGKLNFFVRGKGTNSVDLKFSANLTDPNDDALIEIARTAMDEVTGGAPQGGLKVSAGGVAGQVFIDGKPMGALPAEGATFQLPSGDHRIVVKAPGYADAESSVTVKPATTVEATLTMVEVEPDTPVDWRMISGFGLLGVGAATGAVGLFAALKVNGIANDEVYERFQSAVLRGRDVCDAAKSATPGVDFNTDSSLGAVTTQADAAQVASQCSDATTFEVLQAVMFPIAAVSAGVGFYLLGTSDLFGGDGEGDALEAFSVQPMFGPGGGAVSVSYAF